jgi:replication-associated recombination protein RarA
MKSSHSIKTAIFKAVQKLDPEALSFYQLESLSEEQTEQLLAVADHAIKAEMRDTTAGINDVPPHEFVDYAAEHSRVLLNYLSIRAMLVTGKAPEEDDFSHIGVY